MKQPEVKGKRRSISRSYFNANRIHLMQIFERNCFKKWLTVAVTTDASYANQWANQ